MVPHERDVEQDIDMSLLYEASRASTAMANPTECAHRLHGRRQLYFFLDGEPSMSTPRKIMEPFGGWGVLESKRSTGFWIFPRGYVTSDPHQSLNPANNPASILPFHLVLPRLFPCFDSSIHPQRPQSNLAILCLLRSEFCVSISNPPLYFKPPY